MNALSAYPIFSGHIESLKETSLDDRDGKNALYMTEDEREVINFDEVKKEYISRLGLSKTPSSSDALLENSEGHPVFIEFKNGKVNKQKEYEIQKKIYDSVLIFSDITGCRISDHREKAEFILVYNEKANAQNKEIVENKASYVQDSGAFNDFAKTMGRLAKEEQVFFGLRQFERYCFKEVHTYTENEFKQYLSQ